MILAAYNLAVTLLSPLAVVYLAFRFSGTGYGWRAVAERLGLSPPYLHQTRPGAIWLHAVSVGEVITAVELVRQLKKSFPWEPIFVSVTTPTGRSIAEERLTGIADGVFFAPLDLPWSVRRCFSQLRPKLLIVLEAELWPNLFHEAKRHGAGLMIVNGRLSDRSAPRYQRYRWFFRDVLRFPDAIMTQSMRDLERFVGTGADPRVVRVGGNLKYDIPAAADVPETLKEYLKASIGKPLIVAGSTREGEERPVIAAFQRVLEETPDARLVLAPRRPDRCDEAAAELTAAGLTFVRRSRLPLADGGSCPVILLDSLGELSSLFSIADFVFMGGSLNGWGGHNVLEAAVHGRAVVVGPFMQNFRDITHKMLAGGGLIQTSAAGLGGALVRLAKDPARAAEVGARALEVAKREQGATQAAVEEAVRLAREATPATTPAWVLEALLAGPTWLWSTVTTLRPKISRRRRRLPRPSICVGNLSVGGTGKTPTVIWLCQRLARRGLSPAVLTRGYGRKSAKPATIAPDSRAKRDDVGDEAALMAAKLDEVPIGVSLNRLQAAQTLLESHQADCFVLDDGYQRLGLHRDVNLLLVDASRPFEHEPTLPLGRLREPLSGISRADAVILTRTRPDCDYDSLRRVVQLHNPTCPVYLSQMAPAGVVPSNGGEVQPVESIQGKRLFAFCGVGAPESFAALLDSLGCDLAGEMAFPDHHGYSEADWWRIAAQARDSRADLLITTEKDLVNLDAGVPQSTRTGAPPLFALSIELSVDDGERLLDWIEEEVQQAAR